jgi:hypothetical protein
MIEKVNITFKSGQKSSERSIFAGLSNLGKLFSFIMMYFNLLNRLGITFLFSPAWQQPKLRLPVFGNMLLRKSLTFPQLFHFVVKAKG